MQVKQWMGVCALGLWGAMAVSGCSGHGALIAQKDQEITKLRTETDRLGRDLAAERRRADEASTLNAELERSLADLRDQVKIESQGGQSRITMSDALLFASGSTSLTDKGKSIIDRIVRVAADHPDHEIIFEGHTDNVPIAPAYRNKYRSNWELSTARALAVLHYARERHRLPADRLGAVGYGEFRPVASNATADGRGQNRRVVVIIRKMPARGDGLAAG